MDMLVNTIVKVRPSAVAIGSHHYVQMAESDILERNNAADFESVKILMPTGAAVPSSCEDKLRMKFKGLLVSRG